MMGAGAGAGAGAPPMRSIRWDFLRSLAKVSKSAYNCQSIQCISNIPRLVFF